MTTTTETTDPWSSAAPPEDRSMASDPWGNAPSGQEQASGSSWLTSSAEQAPITNSWTDPFLVEWFDLRSLVNTGVKHLVENFRGFFDIAKQPVDWMLEIFTLALTSVHPFVVIALFALVCWQVSGWRLAFGGIVSLVFLGAMSVWDESMITLALVLTSVFFCLLIGIPTGILMSRSEGFARALRPILDAMQTTPAFVYLVPIVMLFGIGRVPGVIVTIIFAMPPLIRLTHLGIKQVPADLIEASRAFGASRRQILYRVQLPLAVPTIMAGVNQTLMLSLSMVVIASMIAVPGLGLMVLRGIGRLDVGLATVGGLGIVILAILLDRMTQSLGRDARERGTRHWYESGPIGWIYRQFKTQSKT